VGSAPASSRRLTGEGGGTGFEGASVRTPVALERILMATPMASSSFDLVSDLSDHSVRFIVQVCSVLSRVAVSASRSACVEFSVPSALRRAEVTSPRAVLFVVFASLALLLRSKRDAVARL